MIRAMQNQHKSWVEHNFPGHDADQAFLGMVEEVGEMAHAILKEKQGIRGYDQVKADMEIMDSLGDLFIYMMSYCNATGLDLETIVFDTWEEVRQRDWVLYPGTGRPDPGAGVGTSASPSS